MKRTLVVMVLAAAVLASAYWYVNGLRTQVRDLALRADSMEVAADTATEITARLRRELDDTARAWASRVMQVALDRDAVERRLGLEARARMAAEAQIVRLRDSLTAAVTVDDDDVRSATWAIRQEPYTADVRVELPAPPQRGTVWLDVRIDPMPVNVRLGCREVEDGAALQAWAVVSGPAWADLALGDVRQEPGVCNPALPIARAARDPWYVPVLAGAAGGWLASRKAGGAVVGAVGGWAVASAWRWWPLRRP